MFPVTEVGPRPFAPLRFALSLAVASALFASSAAAQTTPQAIDTPGSQYTTATAMNDNGMVVGQLSLSNGVGHAFAWTEAGGVRDLGTSIGTRSHAVAVNRSGVVLGASSDEAGGIEYPFLWTESSGRIDLGTIAPGLRTVPYALNNTGMVVGTWVTASNQVRPWVWTQGGGFVDLGFDGVAVAVNDSGLVIGQGSLNPHAWVWTTQGGYVDLGTLGGTFSAAQFVNAAGLVLGYSALPGNTVIHAFAWTSTTGMVEIGPTAVSTWVTGVNSHGVAAGYKDIGGPTIPFTWTLLGGLVDLPPAFGGNENIPQGINDDGVVVGEASYPDDVWHGVAWTPSGVLDLLPSAGQTYSSAFAVNNQGVVVGGGFTGGAKISSSTALLWTVTAPNVVPTPLGSGVVAQPLATLPDGSTATVAITFGTVTGAGQTTVTTSVAGAPPPDGFKILGGQQPVYYDVSTTATFSGVATLCFTWREGQLQNENNARLFHRENNQWVDITTSRNTQTNTVCGQTSSFSPFIITEQRVFGFYQPVDNLPVVNVMKAGAAVPVKFSLGNGNEGLDIFAAGFPSATAMTCGGGLSDTVDQTSTAGSSSLSFDVATNTYNYVWKSDKAWAGTCRQLVLKLKDGTKKTANFSLTK